MNVSKRSKADSLLKTAAVFFCFSAACVLVSRHSVFAGKKAPRVVSKNKIVSFALPEGWAKEKKPPKNTIVIFQAQKKAPLLNPYVVFFYSELKDVPSTPPPDDLWGQRIVKQIREVDAKAKIISADPSLTAGKPAYIVSAYLSYKKLKKSRTFQKSCQIWDGRHKTMFQFILVCLEKDRKTCEPVLDKLLKSVKIKAQ